MANKKKIHYINSRVIPPIPNEDEDPYLEFTDNFREYFDEYLGTENEYKLREIPVDCYITIVQRLLDNEKFLQNKIEKMNNQFGKIINRRTFSDGRGGTIYV